MTVWRAGSTRSGLGEWLVQRLSAVYMLIYSIYLLFDFATAPAYDYQTWKLWFASGVERLALALFFLSLLLHAWIGMRSVFMDYVKPFWLRFSVTLLTATGLLLLGLWSVQILLQGGT